MAYDADTGAMLWATTIRGSEPVTCDLAVDPGGERLYVTGTVDAHDLSAAYALEDGGRLWTHRQQGYPSFCGQIAVDPAGSAVFVTATSTSRQNGNESRYLTIALDAANGEEAWARRFNASPGSLDHPVDVLVAPVADSVVVTGASGSDIGTVAYDAGSGGTRWVARSDAVAEPNDMTLDPMARRLYVLGTAWGPGENDWDDFILLAYDVETGAEAWSAVWGGAGELREQADAVAVDPIAGRVYVAGSSADGEGSYDAVVIAFAAT